MEERKLVHVKGLMTVEFDVDPSTGEMFNFKLAQEKSSVSEKAPKAPKAEKIKVLTPEDKAEFLHCVIINAKTQQLRLTKNAAQRMGFINDNGDVWQTPNGKNMRVRIGFTMKDSSILPTMSGEYDDTPSSSPMLSDALKLTCPAACKDLFKNFSVLYVKPIEGQDDVEDSKKMFILIPTTFEEVEKKYDEIFNSPELQPMAGNFTGESSDNNDKTTYVGEASNNVESENGEDANGPDSKGEEFIPDFSGDKSLENDDDDIMSGTFSSSEAKMDGDDIFE